MELGLVIKTLRMIDKMIIFGMDVAESKSYLPPSSPTKFWVEQRKDFDRIESSWSVFVDFSKNWICLFQVEEELIC